MRDKGLYIFFFLTIVLFLSLGFSFIKSSDKTEVLSLTKDEKDWLDKHKNSIRISADPSFLPVSQIKNGKMSGIAADYTERIERILGLRFNIVTPPDFDSMLKMAENGEIDIAAAVAKTTGRSEYLLFSQPVIKYPAIIVTRKDVGSVLNLKKMKHMKICVGKGYAVWEYLKSEYPDQVFHGVIDDITGIKGVEKGFYDAAITDLFSASYYIKRSGYSNLKAGGAIGYTYALTFGSVKSEPLLNSILIKALDKISEEERESIYSKWVSLEYSSSYLGQRSFYIVLGLIISGLIFLLIAFFWNRILERKIEAKKNLLSEKVANLDKEIEIRTSDLARVNLELRKAMEEIKVLEGFIPICSSCKKIRSDKEFWENVEEYVADHSDLIFKLSICPRCEEGLSGEEAKDGQG